MTRRYTVPIRFCVTEADALRLDRAAAGMRMTKSTVVRLCVAYTLGAPDQKSERMINALREAAWRGKS